MKCDCVLLFLTKSPVLHGTLKEQDIHFCACELQNSVKHLSTAMYRSNGEPTIVTKDPKFQDVIGQRRTFSEGDVTKISRMYHCSK